MVRLRHVVAALCACTAAALLLGLSGATSRGVLWGVSRGIRPEPLITFHQRDATVELARDMTSQEQELVRKMAVNLLAGLFDEQLLPFRTENYARTKGVLDRVPLEQFVEVAAKEIAEGQRSDGEEAVLENCLEWGPFFTRWPNVTQPYMGAFNCGTQWTFHHDAANPHLRHLFGLKAVFGTLDSSLAEQGLHEARGLFDLVIVPQTMQYVAAPDKAMHVLYDLLKPRGWLILTTPFVQPVMPYPTDFYRFTAEGSEKLLADTGFQVVKSYVGGGDGMWGVCWLLHCGASDLSSARLAGGLRERGAAYSHSVYMLSAQLARKPG